MAQFRYREECYGYSQGQSDCSIYAFEGEKRVGHIDIAYYKRDGRKEAYIKMVEVDPAFRGKGIGRDLIRQLAQSVPYDAIDWGGTTTDGSALKAVMDKEFGTSYKPVEKDEEPDQFDPKYNDDLDNSKLYADLEAWRKRNGYVDEGLLQENLSALEAKYDDKLDKFYVYERPKHINLSAIVVKKEFRNQGIGSQVMKDLCAYADSVGKIITLTPDNAYGGSVPRLKAFYKSFGFIENKGRKKDYEISDAMYRLPAGHLVERSSIYPRGGRMKIKELKQLVQGAVNKALREAGYDQYGEASEALEESPPEGWHGTVAAMKQHHHTGKGKITNPYALAHWMANKGEEPHYKEQPSSKRGKAQKKDQEK